MCEILVKAIDAINKDPDKDRRGCYKRHYPVVVFEDGHKWGKEEGPPKFYIVKIPGVSAKEMQKYCEPEYVTPQITPEPELYRRREWHIDEGLLSPQQLSNIQLSNELTLNSQKAADDIMSRIGG